MFCSLKFLSVSHTSEIMEKISGFSESFLSKKKKKLNLSTSIKMYVPYGIHEAALS